QLSGHRRTPRRVGRQGEDRHPSRPRGPATRARTMTPAELERAVAASLRALPPPHAPGTLAPRVMAAARQRQGVRSHLAHPRPWFAWPVLWQTTFGVGLVTVLASAGLTWTAISGWSALSPVQGDAHWWQIAL